MYEISTNRPIPVDRFRAHGLTKTLRGMYKGDSVSIPESKKSSAYSAAKAAKVRITMRTGEDGDVVVWRVDGPERPAPPAPTSALTSPPDPKDIVRQAQVQAPSETLKDSLRIFG